MKLLVLVTTIVGCAILSVGQDVRTSPVKGGVNISITANQPYDVMSGEKKRAVLSVECSPESEGDASLCIWSCFPLEKM